jgi:hypothetical protein
MAVNYIQGEEIGRDGVTQEEHRERDHQITTR